MPRLKKCLFENRTRKLQLTGEKDAVEPEDINDEKERLRAIGHNQMPPMCCVCHHG